MRFREGVCQRNRGHDAVCGANRAYQIFGASGRLRRRNWHVRGRRRFIPALYNPVTNTHGDGDSDSYGDLHSDPHFYADLDSNSDSDTYTATYTYTQNRANTAAPPYSAPTPLEYTFRRLRITNWKRKRIWPIGDSRTHGAAVVISQ